MLVLRFEAAGNRYALPTGGVVEVVPWIDVKPVARAPEWIAGYFSYRGAVAPALDLGRLASGTPCRCLYNSRLVLVRVAVQGKERLLGLLAERVTTAQLAEEVPREEAGGWGPLLLDAQGVFQLIEVDRLLPADALAALFPS